MGWDFAQRVEEGGEGASREVPKGTPNVMEWDILCSIQTDKTVA